MLRAVRGATTAVNPRRRAVSVYFSIYLACPARYKAMCSSTFVFGLLVPSQLYRLSDNIAEVLRAYFHHDSPVSAALLSRTWLMVALPGRLASRDDFLLLHHALYAQFSTAITLHRPKSLLYCMRKVVSFVTIHSRTHATGLL